MLKVSLKKIYMFCILIPFCLFSGEGILISGNVMGYNGKALPLAHAHILNATFDLKSLLKTTEIDEKGKFEIKIQEPGIYGLLITGVNHERLSIPIILSGYSKEISIEVKLSPLPYKEVFDTIKIIGDWNNYSFGSADIMEVEEDGTFSYRIETKENIVGYQLIGITNDDRSLNGTMADYYIYDGSGDYRSILNVREAEVRIFFDPKKLIKAEINDTSYVIFKKESSFLNTIYNIHKTVEKRKRLYLGEIQKYIVTYGDTRGFSFDWGKLPNMLNFYMNESENKDIKQFAALQLSHLSTLGFKIDSLTLKNILKITPPNSPLWALYPNIPGILLSSLDDESKIEKITKFTEENPDRLVRSYTLVDLIHHYENINEDKFLEYYNKLNDNYSDIRAVRYYLIEFNPDKSIKVGKIVPDFKVELLDKDKFVSNRSLLGRYYLIDFWASWCNPCIREMQGIHKAYEKYKDKNFIILSLSFDKAPGDITKFREKWQMPWLHSFVKGAFDSELAKTFEVAGIPKPILIGVDGEILAVGSELRLENLEKTLKKILNRE